ncbi:MAG: type II toxin-antitoxin system PemK/MazF family toxin [Anaerolineae bacterium]|nr:type II toxin-antitoxin system PemK/MazF family toxin [Anaerolineae bacterium]
MKRGDLYRIAQPPGPDPKKYRTFVIVSRNALITSRFSTVICAPIYSVHDGLATQLLIGLEEGLKHESSIHCDALMSLPKSSLPYYVGSLSSEKINELNQALTIALDLPE